MRFLMLKGKRKIWLKTFDNAAEAVKALKEATDNAPMYEIAIIGEDFPLSSNKEAIRALMALSDIYAGDYFIVSALYSEEE